MLDAMINGAVAQETVGTLLDTTGSMVQTSLASRIVDGLMKERCASAPEVGWDTPNPNGATWQPWTASGRPFEGRDANQTLGSTPCRWPTGAAPQPQPLRHWGRDGCRGIRPQPLNHGSPGRPGTGP